MRPPLLLASASPRRREILAGLGLAFEVRPVDLPEVIGEGEVPTAAAERLARAKARAAPTEDALVLAADTVVVLGEEILGKPVDSDDAARMLRSLAGKTHSVVTGIALRHGSREVAAIDRSEVRFTPLTDEEIAWYVATGEPMDKAGAYAIQGLGSLFVAGLDGNYSNVVGLPVPTLYRLAHELGWDLRSWRR